MFLSLFIAIIFILIIWFIIIYNRLILLQNRVKNSWSQIDIVLKNRFDLLPNLLEVVKEYMAYESDILQRITELRTRFEHTNTIEDKSKLNNAMSAALYKVMVVSENYPELKANESYLALTEQLSEIENKIRYARQFYNDTVEAYNTYRSIIPNVFIASKLGFAEQQYFEIAEQEKELVKVQFK